LRSRQWMNFPNRFQLTDWLTQSVKACVNKSEDTQSTATGFPRPLGGEGQGEGASNVPKIFILQINCIVPARRGEISPKKFPALSPRTKKKHSTFNIQLSIFSERTNGKPWALNVECWLLNVFGVHGEGQGEGWNRSGTFFLHHVVGTVRWMRPSPRPLR
jgi:hypothetical protein